MMDKLISLQTAIDALCKSECGWSNAECRHKDDTDFCVTCDNVKIIKSLPSAQPDIIRCKDCKWYGRADKRRFYRGMDCLQKRIDTIVPDRDFCSRAERKKNGL